MSPACNGTDERLDVVIDLLQTLITEQRMTREEWKKQREMFEGPVTVEHYKDIPPMDTGRKPPKRQGK